MSKARWPFLSCIRSQELWRTKERHEGLLEDSRFEEEIKSKKYRFVSNSMTLLDTPNPSWSFLGSTGVCVYDWIYWVYKEDTFTSGQLEIPLPAVYILSGFLDSGERSRQLAHCGSTHQLRLERNFTDVPILGFLVLMASGITSLTQKWKQDLQEGRVNRCRCD